jgi:hypothetical protein
MVCPEHVVEFRSQVGVVGTIFRCILQLRVQAVALERSQKKIPNY